MRGSATTPPRRAALLLLAAAVCVAACSAGETDKRLVRAYLEALVLEQRWQDWERYYAPGASLNGSRHAQDVMSAMARGMHAAFPDLSIEILEQVAEDGRVATRVRFSGTHEGAFDATPPTGEAVSFQAVFMDRVRDGRVVESWHQVDLIGAMRQVKAISARQRGRARPAGER